MTGLSNAKTLRLCHDTCNLCATNERVGDDSVTGSVKLGHFRIRKGKEHYLSLLFIIDTPSSLAHTLSLSTAYPDLSSRHQRFDKHHLLPFPGGHRNYAPVGKLCSTIRLIATIARVSESAHTNRLVHLYIFHPVTLTHTEFRSPCHPPTRLPSLIHPPARHSPHLPKSRVLLQPIPTLPDEVAPTAASPEERPARTRIRHAVMAIAESVAVIPLPSVEASSSDRPSTGTMGK